MKISIIEMYCPSKFKVAIFEKWTDHNNNNINNFSNKFSFTPKSNPPTVANPIPNSLFTIKPCPPPPPPPPPPPITGATTTSFQFDHHTNMLGLHNIFLIAPPPSSFNQIIPNFNDDHYNIPNTTQYSWTNIKRFQQESSCPRKEYSLNLDEDNNSSSNACKDCGNRAKKECEFRRCRTCCKSKGFGCATHVKSTWVSAARRKEVRRGGDDDGGGGGNKRLRGEKLDSDNNLDASSKFQDARFKQSLPSQVEAPAVFRCIRVAAIDGGEAEVGYQAMVNISGHVFKGFLHKHGINHLSGKNRDSTSL